MRKWRICQIGPAYLQPRLHNLEVLSGATLSAIKSHKNPFSHSRAETRLHGCAGWSKVRLDAYDIRPKFA
ncbi:hypothetical protein DPMN_149576 [Dreissena polymorpha]|uniref:Uncharacterized protein n=1 Tax=Dreissena polymorpha TaxID=45954 RepID=A0A9D4J5F8_DREPO|nr:hypothetical protein DPMN_149576 [Dreissena polymorpha]